jgi:predicted transposase YbfD/YdcC
MAATTTVGSIKRYFRRLKDPRIVRRSHHLLVDIIVLAICGVIADCDDWPEIVLFAQKRLTWFRRFLKLPNGVPSHDTFERVFDKLDPRAFQCCCLAWLRAVADVLSMGHIAIDGKTLCGSAGSKWGALHLVSAWATQANLTLGQVAVDSKSNEITAIPPLLELLDLRGALVTIGAMGCQKEIAKEIVARGGDYVLAVKGNQEHLLEDVQTTVERALNEELPAHIVLQHSTTKQATNANLGPYSSSPGRQRWARTGARTAEPNFQFRSQRENNMANLLTLPSSSGRGLGDGTVRGRMKKPCPGRADRTLGRALGRWGSCLAAALYRPFGYPLTPFLRNGAKRLTNHS